MNPEVIAVGVACAVLAVASALLSAAQTALFSLQPVELRGLRERDPRLASALDALLAHPRRLQGVLLLADNLTNIPLILLSLYALRELQVAPAAPVWLATLLLFALIVLACDLLPKLAGLGRPFAVSRIAFPLLRVVVPLVGRPARWLQVLSEGAARRLLPGSWKPRGALDADEFETLVRIGEEQGTLQSGEGRIIREILRLGDRTVKDCMTPRVEMFAIPDDLTNEEALERVRRGRFRRVPVFAETPDNIVGTLDVRDLLEHPDRPYAELLLPPSFVPETMRALDLLRAFRTRAQAMAVIVDEYGGTEGLITASDLHEQILGEAAPRSDEGLYIEQLEGGRFVVSGHARLDDLAPLLGVDLEVNGVDTIGGLVFNRLGHLPRPDDRLALPGLELTVRRVSRRRIEELLIEPVAGGEPGGSEEVEP
jgi:putative hemolysin